MESGVFVPQLDDEGLLSVKDKRNQPHLLALVFDLTHKLKAGSVFNRALGTAEKIQARLKACLILCIVCSPKHFRRNFTAGKRALKDFS